MSYLSPKNLKKGLVGHIKHVAVLRIATTGETFPQAGARAMATYISTIKFTH